MRFTISGMRQVAINLMLRKEMDQCLIIGHNLDFRNCVMEHNYCKQRKYLNMCILPTNAINVMVVYDKVAWRRVHILFTEMQIT